MKNDMTRFAVAMVVGAVLLLGALAWTVNAVVLSVGPYDVTVAAEDVPRVKDQLMKIKDRTVLVQQWVAVEPPIPEAEWDFEMEPGPIVVNGGNVVSNSVNVSIPDPAMALTGDETTQQLNAKLKAKLEWVIGVRVQRLLNLEEREALQRAAIAAAVQAVEQTNDVFAIEVAP